MISLEDFIAATGAEVRVSGRSRSFEGFAHDSRTVAPGECFVAVGGMHKDGHEFSVDALERGASALVVERAWLDQHPAIAADLIEHARRAAATMLVVDDVRESLCGYAHFILSCWKPTVIAVTGSTGKTTTKEAIASVLALRAPTFRSWRNYNDLLGLPLSLGRLEPAHRFAVLELGADHPGEIAGLCSVVQPQVGVVTNVSPVHLQYFDGVEALQRELAQLPALLPRPGLAVLNADDERTLAMADGTPAAVRFFAPVKESAGTVDDRLTLHYHLLPMAANNRSTLALVDAITRETSQFAHLHADHWAYAVLAALTVGAYFGVPRAEALSALRQLRPLPGRMSWLDGAGGTVLLDDSHNATPSSAAAGLDALDAIAGELGAVRIAVLGDMLRLGRTEDGEHRKLGKIVAQKVDYLVSRGTLAATIAESAIQAGLLPERVIRTHLAEDTAGAVKQCALEAAREGKRAVIYIKGSEETRMEQVTALLLAHPEQAENLLDRQTQAWQRVVVMRPDRPTWLEIDLGVIAGNTRSVQKLVDPQVRILVSLKADAYGHGAVRVARTVLHNGASWLGVATVSEAVPLREAGIDAPILVFGYTAPWQARDSIRLDLRSTVYSPKSRRRSRERPLIWGAGRASTSKWIPAWLGWGSGLKR